MFINRLKELFICSWMGHKFTRHGKYLHCSTCNKVMILSIAKGGKK